MAPTLRSATRARRLPEIPESSPSQTITFSDLNNDVLLLIYEHLDKGTGKSDKPIQSLSFAERRLRERTTPIKSLICTNRHLRDLFAPYAFKNLHMWLPLKELPDLPRFQYNAQKLRIDIYAWSHDVELFKFMHSLQKLRFLHIHTHVNCRISAFSDPDIDHQVFLLPSMETLIVSNCAASLAGHCPNLKDLIIKPPRCHEPTADVELKCRLMAEHLHPSSGLSTKLTSFEVTSKWPASEVQYLTATFPHLQHLCIKTDSGIFSRRHFSLPSDVLCASDITKLLGDGLKDLRTLRLSSMPILDPENHRKPNWLDVPDQSEGTRKGLWQEHETRRVEAENSIARSAFGNIERLVELWVGKKRVARRLPAEESCDGEDDVVKWMWSRSEKDMRKCGLGSLEAKFKAERGAVVIRSEMGM
ncbi:uncharacterized protein K460DRAFT_393245 [Cucurbitaria berberidis CBS 394.84]|uniref:Uncharacterized protein n=1 Tax=Cucurbitaria berberidis CBS 394.84 TaxID=1168544 RepID=A0A9P4GKN0_9PLEO|nr:uncharacterized protein K460DRAFT_393245 [Cucurbitaria berberidis CBS 394.84]KAF1848073.1 hypothetical protein K460DRAFT_393245 [Cucurbitaria berberidis CBS 394.84]